MVKKVITVQIEKIVRETWVMESEETAQELVWRMNNPNTNPYHGRPRMNMNYVKKGERVVSAEIFSQEVKEVEFYPWVGYEK